MNSHKHNIFHFRISVRKIFTHLGILLLILNFTIQSSAQSDKVRLDNLIKETNERYLVLIANAIYLNPHELRNENLSFLCRNIRYVDSINIKKIVRDKEYLSSIVVKNNKTLIYKQSNRRDSYTYMYHKDGRMHKKFRGRSLNDHFIYSDNGYLIQHGNGGETKKAKLNDNKFEWYNAKRNRLEYVSEFGDDNKIKSFKTLGHHFGRNVEYELEAYTFENDQLVQLSSWTKYKGSPEVKDTSTTVIRYDSLGLINGLGYTSSTEYPINIKELKSKVEILENNHITISISANDLLEYSITYDQYDNWIEEFRTIGKINRTFHYRKKRRRR